MSEYKHTPGPWESATAKGYENGKPVVTEYFVRRPEDDVAIAADILDPDTEDPSEANACLIAAAPDTAAACERVMQAIIQGSGEWKPSPEVDDPTWSEDAHVEITLTVADCRALKHAIAKARGEADGPQTQTG